MTHKIAPRYWPEIKFPVHRALERYRTYLALSDIAVKIKRDGWRIDAKRAQGHEQAAMKRAERYKGIFLKATGLKVDALGAAGTGQTNSIRDYFWETLKAPPVVFHKRTKKPQFTTAALVTYATDFKDEPLRTAAMSLLGLRKNLKSAEFCRTYQQCAPRVHLDFNFGGTKGERASCSGAINVQQVPSREPVFDFGKGPEKIVKSLRDIFVADPGCVLIKADFDGAEAREIAYTTGCQFIIGMLERNEDLHMRLAVQLFKELNLSGAARKTKEPANAEEELANRARQAEKSLLYGLSYQLSSRVGKDRYTQQYKQLKESFPELHEQYMAVLAKRFFEICPEIKQWHRKTEQNIETQGMQQLSINGAALYLPNTMRGKNQALNFQMQSTLGAIINRALVDLDKRLDWKLQTVKGQIHDELVVQAPIKEADNVAQWVEECMGAPAQIGDYFVGIPAEADIGPNWGNVTKRAAYAAA